MSELLLDRAGRRRSPATMPGFHTGHAPASKGLRYPAQLRGERLRRATGGELVSLGWDPLDSRRV